MKRIIQDLCPPLVWRGLKKIYTFLVSKLASKKSAKISHIEWEYIPQGWLAEKLDSNIKGWNVESILEAYKANWQTFLRNLEDTSPFGISPESDSDLRNNLIFHNIMMTYAYVLALASRQKNTISMLDWGGGIGHYYLISKNLVPEIDIDYHCKDVPVLAEYGRKLFPEAHFYTEEICFERSYDFVLASTSLQYSQDWVTTLKGLAQATSGYLFITRLPILQNASSFVMVQRPYQYGYDTEYLGWCLNRQEFLSMAKENQLQLIREFVVEPLPPIHNAPEQPDHWGFLFSKIKNQL
jgi:putative methyltransferase (TIGR04325 family)